MSFAEAEKVIVGVSKYADTICYHGKTDEELKNNRDTAKRIIIAKNPLAKWLRCWEDSSILPGERIGRLDVSDLPLLLTKSADECWMESIGRHE